MTAQFNPGDRVLVANNHPFAGLTVTVVRYWRNGYFIVREDRHQTTVAADADKLTLAPINDTLAASADAIARTERIAGPS